jgi:hypothetical protein
VNEVNGHSDVPVNTSFAPGLDKNKTDAEEIQSGSTNEGKARVLNTIDTVRSILLTLEQSNFI